MGKTHLLHAVGNHIRDCAPQTRILYISAERFLNECVSCIRRGEMDKFKQRYREKCDLLLMDDIQVLGRGEAVQEEFFHTFNTLHQDNKQIVISSDRPPKSIAGLEKRLQSRLEWGMLVDVGTPDLETRIAILEKKCIEKSFPLNKEILY